MNFVLGGTHGLGQQIAKAFQQQGEQTFVVGRTYDEATHGAGTAVDLSNGQDFKKLIEQIDKTDFNRFFWVAGYGYNGDFSEQVDPHKMALVNFANAVPVAQAVWKKLANKTEPTNFVIVSSTTGEKARADEAVYASTKHAQVGFARSLGLESERLGLPIRVALFMPGGMQTPFWDAQRPESYDTFLDPAKVSVRIVERVIEQQTPFYEETIPKDSL